MTPVSPSVAVYCACWKLTVSAAPSSSASVTVVLAGLPSLTAVGSAPKPSSTVSSSKSVSSSAVTVSVWL